MEGQRYEAEEQNGVNDDQVHNVDGEWSYERPSQIECGENANVKRLCDNKAKTENRCYGDVENRR